jgi:beta-mannosidase
MDAQITHAFGVTADTLEKFSRLSQLTQAEADKFFIERNRLGKWERGSGIFFWNLIDGFPQFSDAVVDYYGNKKTAYHVIKRSFEPVALMCREPQNGKLSLVGVNDTLAEVSLCYRVTDVTSGTPIAQGDATLAANANTELFAFACDQARTTMYLIEWEMDGKCYRNHYLCGTAPLDPLVAEAGYQSIGL